MTHASPTRRSSDLAANSRAAIHAPSLPLVLSPGPGLPAIRLVLFLVSRPTAYMISPIRALRATAFSLDASASAWSAVVLGDGWPGFPSAARPSPITG